MITSYKNPKIKDVRDLLGTKKHRDRTRQMVIEGVRLAEEAIRHQVSIQTCFFSENLSERGKKLLQTIRQRSASVEEISTGLMHRLSDTQHAQGILLVCSIPERQIPTDADFLLVLDGINDPGNLGAIFRSAAALDVDGILLTPGSTDPYSPKALRAGMGAQLHLPIDWRNVPAIKDWLASLQAPFLLTTTTMDCEHASWHTDLTGPICLVIGNEAHGISNDMLSISDQCVRIPIAENTESFNVAIAAAILMYEIRRQRIKK